MSLLSLVWYFPPKTSLFFLRLWSPPSYLPNTSHQWDGLPHCPGRVCLNVPKILFSHVFAERYRSTLHQVEIEQPHMRFIATKTMFLRNMWKSEAEKENAIHDQCYLVANTSLQNSFLWETKDPFSHSSYNWSIWWQMGEYNGKKKTYRNMEIILIYIKTIYHFQWLNVKIKLCKQRLPLLYLVS